MDLDVRIERFPHPEAQHLLRQAVWGTPGQLQYRYPEGLEVGRVPEDHVLVVGWLDGEVVAAHLLVRQPMGAAALLLVVRPDVRRRGIGPKLLRAGAGAAYARWGPDCQIIGTIDASNAASLEASRDETFDVGRLEALTISRRRANEDPSCTEVGFDDLLAQQAHPEWVVDTGAGRCFERRVGRRAAGVYIEPHLWSLVSLGHPVLDRALPLVTRAVGQRPEAFRFGFVHYWWGDPSLYDGLWTHAMAATGLTSIQAVGWTDDPAWPEVRRRVRRGAVGRAVGVNRLVLRADRPGLDHYCFSAANAL